MLDYSEYSFTSATSVALFASAEYSEEQMWDSLAN